MYNIKMDKWLKERSITLDKSFIEELQALSITYKKTSSSDY
jgi:hypothetical protein